MSDQPRRPNGEYTYGKQNKPTALRKETTPTQTPRMPFTQWADANGLDPEHAKQLNPDRFQPSQFTHRTGCAHCGAANTGDAVYDTAGKEHDICSTCYDQTIGYLRHPTSKLEHVLSQESADSPAYDDMRTELCRRNNGKRNETMERENLMQDLSQPDSGATWNPITGETPSHGFCYSPYPELSTVIDNRIPDQTEDLVDRFIKKNQKLLHKPNHYVGLWRSPHDGNLYLDVSVVGEDAAEARTECAGHDQQSFFDLQTFTSVTVDANAKSGQ